MKNITLVVLAFAIQFLSAQTPVFQDTKGELTVNNSGALNYSVAIATPAGLNGAAPSISLVYNSNNNDGLAGFGWNIAGLSAISRVNSRLDLDGKITPIEGDDLAKDKLDAFSLDGQRLILKKNSFKTNGVIEFETENFSHLKIDGKVGASSTNMLGNFKITSPNGSVSTYNGTLIGPYSIKNTLDALGNKIDYIYTGDYISEIKWGRNINSTTAGMDNVMRFIYKNRVRIEYSDVLTTPKIADKILDRIEVYSQGKLFRKYILTHETIQNNYQRITQVQEFNAANEGANPVVFTYEDSSRNFKDWGYYESPTGAPLTNIQLTGDFDGNGEMDFIANNNLYLNSIGNDNKWDAIAFPTGFVADKKLIATVSTLQTNGKMYQNQMIAKMLGNKLDIYNRTTLAYSKSFVFPTAGSEPVVNDSSKGFCLKDTNALQKIKDDIKNGVYDKIHEGDFNGDGLSEILYRRTIKSTISTSRENSITLKCNQPQVSTTAEEYYLLDIRPNGLSPMPNLKKVTNITLSNNVYVFDINGDGTDEISTIDNSTKKFISYNLTINDNGTVITPRIMNETLIPEFSEDKQLVWGDFNGDSREDLMIPKGEGSSDWFVYQFMLESNQKYEYKNFVNYKTMDSPRQKDIEVRGWLRNYTAADMDNDGKSDFIVSEYETWREKINDFDSRSHLRLFHNLGGPKTLFGDESRHTIRSGLGADANISLLVGKFVKANGLIDFNIAFIQGNRIWRFEFQKNIQKDLLIRRITEAGGSYSTQIVFSSYPYYSIESTEVYPNVQLDKLPKGINLVDRLAISASGKEAKWQSFEYAGFTFHSQGLGGYGFKKVGRSNLSDQSCTVKEMSPSLLGKTIREYTLKNCLTFPRTLPDFNSENRNLLSFTEYEYNRTYQSPTFPPKPDYTKVKTLFPIATKTKNFRSGVISTSTIKYDAFWNPIKSTTVTQSNEKYDEYWRPSKSSYSVFSTNTTDLQYKTVAKPTKHKFRLFFISFF